jgi:hypothetical protein
MSQLLTLARATETDVEELFKWAEGGHERTTNQRVKPGLLIIVNRFKGEDDWLDVNYATSQLLSQLELSGTFAEQKERWEKRGKAIETAEDLILCYYASFRVICIPDLPYEVAGMAKPARLIAQQYRTLYTEIRWASQGQRESKRRVGMNLDTESFLTYVEHAFHQLSKELKSSIDFYYLDTRDVNSSAPSQFSEHLTGVIVKILNTSTFRDGKYRHSNVTGQEEQILKRLIPYLGLCISTQISTRIKDPAGKLLLTFSLSCS